MEVLCQGENVFAFTSLFLSRADSNFVYQFRLSSSTIFRLPVLASGCIMIYLYVIINFKMIPKIKGSNCRPDELSTEVKLKDLI